MMRQAHASRMSILPSMKKKKVKKKSFDSTRTKTRNRSKKNNNNGNERKWPNAIDKPNVHTHTHTQTKFKKKIDTHRESHHDGWHNPPGLNSYFVLDNLPAKTIKSSSSHDQSTISSLRAHDNNNPKRTQFQLVFI